LPNLIETGIKSEMLNNAHHACYMTCFKCTFYPKFFHNILPMTIDGVYS